MNFKNKKIKNVFYVLLYLFAAIGFLFFAVFVAMQFGWLNVKGSASERNSYFKLENNFPEKKDFTLPEEKSAWANSPEWNLMREVFIRDQEIIKKAGIDAGISPRLILGGVIGEQFRFLTNRRESFKQYFEPMKILASLSKFSFGIAGLKPDTVKKIEENLKNEKSTFYLGKGMEQAADYADGVGSDEERMSRITDVKNPYYSYLYVGLFMRQAMMQWKNAGYNIDNRPEIITTLYNLGFNRSIPKENAEAGGAVIDINGTSYTFGDLGYEFFYSNELIDIFPR